MRFASWLLLATLTCPPAAWSWSAPDDEAEDGAAGEEPLEGHSHQGDAFNEGPRQAAYLMGNPDCIDFPVETDSEEAQAFFTQGVGQLHGFWYFEAERSFRQAAAIDPECAMAYWGMAMANVENEERAAGFCREAWLRREGAGDRGRRHIEALAEYYSVDHPVPEEGKKEKPRKPKGDELRRPRYVRALEEILWEYPNDVETKALLVNFLWLSKYRKLPTTSRYAIEALLQEVLDAEPMHPAHHYRIHLWDSPETAARVVDSAVRAGHTWPKVAHQWHMGGHIFDKLGRHADAAWQQEASARVDHAHMMRDRVLPDQIHNFAHNNEWLTRSLRHCGRLWDAVDLAKNMIELPRHPEYNLLDKPRCSASFGRQRLLETLELYEQWQLLVELCGTMYLEPAEHGPDEARRVFMLGEAYAFLGELDAARAQIERLGELIELEKRERARSVDEAEAEALEEELKSEEREAALLAALKGHDPALKQMRDGIESLEALITVLGTEPIVARAEGTAEEGTAEEDDAEREDPEYPEEVEDALKAIRGGPLPKEHVARLHLDLGLFERAEKLARSAAKGEDGIAVPRANLAFVLDSLGERDEALEVFAALREESARFDLDAPPFARLAELARAGGHGADWRVPFVLPSDVGVRPDLDELGPRRWSPPAAPAWACEDADGQLVALDDYAGRPVVVILFLGFGCLHCVEQLEAFAPAAADFERAGIAIVTIGSDDREAIARSLEGMAEDERPPFPVLADPELDVFRSHRAYDDFEELPLHGTFLVDGAGRVRWQDIRYEPFVDHEFLLAEAQRLLGLPGPEAILTAAPARSTASSGAGASGGSR